MNYKFDTHHLEISVDGSSIRIPLLQLKQAMEEAEFADRMKRFDRSENNVQEEMVKN